MQRKNLRFVRTISFLVLFLVFVSGCAPSGPGKPTVVILSPASGSEFQDGETVAIQSTTADATGVVRVELIVDNIVARTDASPTPQGQSSFTLIQTWKATVGNHTLVVRAYNAAGGMSDPVAVAVSILAISSPPAPTTVAVIPPAAGPPTATPTIAVPLPPPASPTVPSSSSASSAPCVNDSAFVADVTVPDGTNFAAGQSFNKIWRLSNSGSCTWGVGYQLVFVSGTNMAGSTAVSVPATAPGATADILVPMSAPASGGTFTGTWRMRAASGALFGKTITVKITVVGAVSSSSASSSSSSSSSASGCVGTPNIASFTGSAPSVAAAASIFVVPGTTVTLNWGAVTNADSIEIDNGIGGQPSPGSTTVTPGSTTTYTLTAYCGSTTRTAQVKVNIAVLPPPVMLVYDFVANASAATWQNNSLTMLPFPGTGSESTGFVRYVNSPSSTMEDGSTPSRCLETHPKFVTGGTITGSYTSLFASYSVHSSDHFYATVGFLNGAKSGVNDANVAFKVWIRTASAGNHSWTFNHAYNGSLVNINIDLSPYTGQSSDFILEVDALNPSASRDWACWTSALISR